MGKEREAEGKGRKEMGWEREMEGREGHGRREKAGDKGGKGIEGPWAKAACKQTSEAWCREIEKYFQNSGMVRAQPNSREKGANYAAVFDENVKLRGNYAEG
jgi:hypothetical protein